MGKKENIEKLMATGDYKLEDLQKMHFKKLETMASSLDGEEKEEVKEKESTSIIPRKNTVRKQTTKFDSDMLVGIVSASTGNVFYTSEKSGFGFDFNEIGEYEEIPYHELVTLKNKHGRYLKEPFIIILDEEVAESFGLNYDNTFLELEDMESYLDQESSVIEKTIKLLSKGSRDMLINHVANAVRNEEDISINKVRMIEKISGLSILD